jgi:hypothetical protein
MLRMTDETKVEPTPTAADTQAGARADASPVAVMAGPEPDHPAARTFLHTLRALDYVTMACPEHGLGAGMRRREFVEALGSAAAM